MKARTVILGGGGHARVVLDILAASNTYQVEGFLSKEPNERTEELLGIPRLGTDDALSSLRSRGISHVFVAIGDNSLRRACTESAVRHGLSLMNAISPAAIVSPHATLGSGVAVMAGAVINCGAEIGNGAIVNTNASVDHDCSIGDFAHVACGVTLAGNVSVGAGALLGVGASVVPGISIGSGAIVGAGAVVVRDLPSGVMAFGVPATVRRRLEVAVRT